MIIHPHWTPLERAAYAAHITAQDARIRDLRRRQMPGYRII